MRTLALILALHLCLMLWAGPVFFDSDDRNYKFQAEQIARGDWALRQGPDVWTMRRSCHVVIAHRVGVILPAAVPLALWPRGEWAASLWPLLASLGTVVLVCAWGRGSGASTAAAFLLATSPIQLRFGGALLPEVPLAFWMLASALAFRRRANPALVALLWFCAWATKETSIWLLPYFATIFARREDRAYGVELLFYGAAGAGLYVALCWMATGHALSRFVCGGWYAEYGAGPHDPHGWELARRLTWGPVEDVFARRAWLPIAVPAVLGLLRAPRAVLVLAGMLTAAWWWGSTSLTEYHPLIATIRYSVPLLAPACLLAGHGLEAIEERWKVARLWPVAYGAAAVAAGLLGIYGRAAT